MANTKEILAQCEKYFEAKAPRFAIILLNGTRLISKLQEDTIERILPTISKLVTKLPPTYIFSQPPVIIFRISENVFLLLLTKLDENSINQMLEEFMASFGQFFQEFYAEISSTVGNLIDFGVLTIAREHGPEPFGWYSKEEILSEKKVSEYAVSAMMILMNERLGAKNRVLNFHPFISENQLGLIYVFQIPNSHARAGSFDAAILLITDYEYRANIYPKYLALENLFSEIADEITDLFQKIFPEQAIRPITDEDRGDFHFIISNLFYRLNTLRIGIVPEHQLKQEMKAAIRKLNERV